MASVTSASASRQGLPASTTSRAASSKRRPRMRAAARKRTVGALAGGGVTPGGEGRPGCVERPVGVVTAGAGHRPDDLVRAGRG